MRCSSDDEALAEITTRIRRRLGLAKESLVDSAIHSAIRRRMGEHDLSAPRDYLPLLDREREMDLLLDEVVIPETWFARDEKPFAALVDAARGHLLPAAGDRPLNLLSAPCSTGEEPYSMAIALIEGGVSPSLFRIDAIDICHRSLARAREGSYGAHSFRGDMPERWIVRHFDPTPEGYRIRPEIRRQVRFHRGNLLELDACCDTPFYDVIFCRNLLIYLEEHHRTALLAELHRRLVPGGLLVVGHSEAPRIPRELFREWGTPGCFAFARRLPGEAGHPPPSPAPPRPARRHPAPAPSAWRPKPAAQEPPPPAEDPLSRLRALADRGEIAAASTLCLQLLHEDVANPDLHCMNGLLALSRGERRDAEGAFRRALYLDPAHYESLVHLSLLLRDDHRTEEAQLLENRIARLHGAGATNHG